MIKMIMIVCCIVIFILPVQTYARQNEEVINKHLVGTWRVMANYCLEDCYGEKPILLDTNIKIENKTLLRYNADNTLVDDLAGVVEDQKKEGGHPSYHGFYYYTIEEIYNSIEYFDIHSGLKEHKEKKVVDGFEKDNVEGWYYWYQFLKTNLGDKNIKRYNMYDIAKRYTPALLYTFLIVSDDIIILNSRYILERVK